MYDDLNLSSRIVSYTQKSAGRHICAVSSVSEYQEK